MEEELDVRKKLAQRLFVSERAKKNPVPITSRKTARLQALETHNKPSVTMVPKSGRTASLTAPGRKPKQLEPLSPHIKAKLLSKPPGPGGFDKSQELKPKPIGLDQSLREPSLRDTSKMFDASMTAKTISQKRAKESKKHVHGDDIFDRPDIKELTETKQLTPFDFIQIIKRDPELCEDFWYCNRRSNAYDFEFVKFDARNEDEYLTISSRGVTHYINREAIFMTLQEWEREYKLFNKLQYIPFFAKYKQWKNFSLWKNMRRRNMIQECKYKLSNELFMLDKTLREAMLDVRALNFRISRWDLIDLNFDSIRTLDEFNHDQEKKRDVVAEQLEDLETQMKQISTDSCNISMRDFRKKYNLRNPDEDEDEENEEEPEPFLVGDESHKQMPYTQEATIRSHYKKLARYIRLCDYTIVDAKLSLSMQSALKVHKSLSVDPNAKKKESLMRPQNQPLFTINTVAEDTAVVFAPACDEIKEAIEDAIMKGIAVVCNNELLISSPEFEIYVSAIEDTDDKQFEEEIDLLQMVINDGEFKSIDKMIKKGVDQAFVQCNEYTSYFDSFLEQYAINEQMDLESYREADLEDFKVALDKYKEQEKEFQAMKDTADIGIMQLNSTEMKKFLVPSPTRCLTKIEDLLPELAKQRGDLLIEQMSTAHRALANAPQNVDEYIVYAKFLKETDEKMGEYSTRYGDLKDLMQMMDIYKIKYTEGVKRAYDDSLSALGILRQRVQTANDRAESDKIRFTRELRDKVGSISSTTQEQTSKLADEMLGDRDADPLRMVNYLKEIGENVEQLFTQSRAFNSYQDELEIERTNFEYVSDLRRDFKIKNDMWTALYEWGYKVETWNNTQFAAIDVADISGQVDEYYRIAKRSMVLEENGNFVPEELKGKVEALKDTMPVVISLRDPCLKQRHWDAIVEALDQEIDINEEGFTLQALIDMKVNDKKDEIADIALKANKEEELEKQLKLVKDSWEGIEFETPTFKDSKDVFILGGLDDVITLLEDSMVSITNIITNRYVGPLWEEVEPWQKRFALFQENLDEWLNVQKQWMYLETIFTTPDIKQQLPAEQKKFMQVDSAYKTLMRGVNERPFALEAATQKSLNRDLKDWNLKLEQIQRALEEYLDKKRKSFARFFFLSNDELLEILARAKVPQAVQPHLKKCFEAIYSLDFGEENKDEIFFMISAEGERVQMTKNLRARGPVEEWLSNVEADMMKSLRRELKAGYQDFEDEPARRADWTRMHPSQTVSSVSQIWWCCNTEEALNNKDDPSGSLAEWYDTNLLQLEELIQLIRSDLDEIERRRIVALVTNDVHNRDMLEEMKNEEISGVQAFAWQQQLRYYWSPEHEDCVIRQVNAEMFYGHEFLGATTRLVITPLTDKCWLTITGALHIKLGAAPAGPAGTGKTESVKDLAKALGRFCVVFNCSEQITYKMMEKLFMGLCYSGSWACLDEFNRIDIEVLSVIAYQLMTIRNAKMENKTEFYMEDKLTQLQPTAGVFITMNPGYAGRTELPDNLKVLFRPMSMMVPNYTLIAEIMLFAEGFSDAKMLSGKMTKLYKLSSEQLSQQDHYDFGMRAVKSVLVMAGALKRLEPDLSEDILLIRAMRDSNVPKFLRDDLVLFFAIVGDLFPGVEVPFIDYGSLKKSILDTIPALGFQCVEEFVMKTIQLFETFNVRFGVMLVGPTNGAKTTCYNVLQGALTDLRKNKNSPNVQHQVVEYTCLNPKSITMGELFGLYDQNTGDWKDGLASMLMREYSEREDKNYRWVVFDGPVDAKWIENMNTVLDDNMMLCLANSERIKLKKEMRMLFEVQDLAVASPATVSRCGMVYMNADTVGWESFVKTWISRNLGHWPEGGPEHVWGLFANNIEEGLKFIRKNSYEPIPTNDIALVDSLCSLLLSLTHEDTCPRLKDEPAHFTKLLDKLFLYSYIWTIGGAMDNKSMLKFDSFCTNQFDMDLPKGSLYDMFISQEKICGDYKQWNAIMPEFKYDKDLPYFELVVPTKDTVRYSELLKQQIQVHKPVFITGYTGVGKSVIISDTLAQMKDTHNVFPIMLTFSARTSSIQAETQIVSKLDRQRKDLLGAPGGRKTVIMIDDVNMPEVEEYGAQPPIELMRQFCGHGYYYDRQKHIQMKIYDCNVVCCAAPPEGGRAPLTQRFTSRFHLLCVPPPIEDTLTLIFKSIMDGFLEQFKQDIQGLSGNVVNATILIYNKVLTELLPTPQKSHYTFNLRDVSKVFQGILQLDKRSTSKPETVIKVWIHESCRVFYDRLINVEDRRWFTDNMTKMCLQEFKRDWSHEELFEKHVILFGDFMRGDDPEDMMYEEIEELDKLRMMAARYLDEYNDNNTSMNLVFFQSALEHLTRICRILKLPRGNAMLVGVGGSGKQSLTRLASSMTRASCFQIQVTKTYNQAAFREDLKKLFLMAGGIDGSPTTFLMTDTQIAYESFLEDINNILNSGEVANLFLKDELETIEQDMRPIAAARKVYDNMYGFFIGRVRENLHIVLCMSPVGPSLRVRMRMFPSLVNCCTINWVDPWPEDALLSVSQDQLKALELPDLHGEAAKKTRDAFAYLCRDVHLNVLEIADDFMESLGRKVYITPKSYLDNIGLFFKLLGTKQEEVSFNKKRYLTGVNMLIKTNEDVGQMQIDLTALKPILEKKKIESEELMIVVERDSVEANKVKEVVEVEEAEVNAQAQEIAKVQETAQEALDEAMPALQEALGALDLINKGDISEIKTFANPPALVKYTLETICILLGEKQDWDSVKKMLANTNFIDRLKTFDKDNISSSIINNLKKKINANKEYTPQDVFTKNRASASLCKWTLAMDKYAKVSKEVEPLKENVAKMNEEMEEANAKLQIAQGKLKVELDKVAGLQAQLKEVQDETERLNFEAAQTASRLDRASILTEGLAEENVRWQAQLEILDYQLKNILGDVFLSCSAINYYGPFTGEYRKKMVDFWIEKCGEYEIQVNPQYNIQEVMGDPMTIRDWNIMSLPTDDVSVNNGIIVDKAERWPLMIDPQEQAKKWIRNMEEKKDLCIVKMQDKDMSKQVENCIKNGRPLLIEDIQEALDPSLGPVLAKNLIVQGAGRYALRMGNQDIDYDMEFRMYITTKMTNPHYLPDVTINTTLINFTVTVLGLEEQLLGDVVKQEKPSIERDKARIVTSMSNDQKKLKGIEDSILHSLANVEGNILDNESLIENLKGSKEISNEINERMIKSEETKKEIEIAREKYQVIATRGSILYFVIANLAGIDPMYQFSLFGFSRLFNDIIAGSQKSDDIEERLKILLSSVTEQVFINVCRGLFNQHKIIFSFLITAQILRKEGHIADDEWNLILKGVAFLPSTFKKVPNPMPDVINEKYWDVVTYLQNTSSPFMKPLLGQEIADNMSIWKEWITSAEPHNEDLPDSYSHIDIWHKLLLIKAFRGEKVNFMIINFIEEKLGHQYVSVPPVKMTEAYEDTKNRAPIVFILSTGADPNSLMRAFATEKNYLEKLDIVSLGQGQGDRAKKFIESGCKSGNWIMLQNCHLYRTWMPELEKIIAEFEDPNKRIHEDFRLFLTAMPCDFFPVPVLQIGLKITIEPPKGLKSNIMRSLNTMTDETLQDCAKPKEWKKIIMALCFFHSVVQERRKFGPLGWNIRYEFNESDLETSWVMLKNFLDEPEDRIPWDAIKFMVGEINYGGRVTDDWDRRCLNSILSIYVSTDVLKDTYKFSESGKYYAPEDSNLQFYKDYITGLPMADPPEIFGMHENSNISLQRAESDAVTNTALSIQPRDSGKSGGKSPDEFVREVVEKIQEQLPLVLTMQEAHASTFMKDKNGLMESLATFLGQEMSRFNKLLRTMDRSLSDTIKAIKGIIVMSPELDAMYQAILNNQIPPNWMKVGYPSLKPLGSWVSDLLKRVTFIRDWLTQGKPIAYWLASFFFPQGFLTAVQQSFARKYQIPIDILNFSFEMQQYYDVDSIDDPTDDGCYIYGLFMDSCRWDIDSMQLEDSHPGVIYDNAPVILFTPTENYTADPEEYSMPVYKTTVRAGVLSTTGHSTNFIVPIECPTNRKPIYWVLKGAAFMCALND